MRVLESRYERRELKYFCIYKLGAATVRCGYRVECCDFQRHNIKIELAIKFDFENPQKALDKNEIFLHGSMHFFKAFWLTTFVFLVLCTDILFDGEWHLRAFQNEATIDQPVVRRRINVAVEAASAPLCTAKPHLRRSDCEDVLRRHDGRAFSRRVVLTIHSFDGAANESPSRHITASDFSGFDVGGSPSWHVSLTHSVVGPYGRPASLSFASSIVGGFNPDAPPRHVVLASGVNDATEQSSASGAHVALRRPPPKKTATEGSRSSCRRRTYLCSASSRRRLATACRSKARANSSRVGADVGASEPPPRSTRTPHSSPSPTVCPYRRLLAR